jgi:hypothetical protein
VMAIDARIAAVTVVAPSHCGTCNMTGKDQANSWDDCPTCHGATKDNPAVRLKLEPREPGCVAGQRVLTILNPPTVDPNVLAGLIGTEIWGSSSCVMVGQTKWADRIGYTKIKLVEPIPKPPATEGGE